MRHAVFVTGTDTGIGKSIVSAALLNALHDAGIRAVGMKPVASGCLQTHAGLRNEDAQLLLEHGLEAPYEWVNPVALAEPIAPHLAARHAGREISLAPLRDAFARLAQQAQLVVVEGVGGWMVPLSESLLLVDLVRELQLPVVLVVGLRLGCLNHALLSARAIQADGCELLGWIGNPVDARMACVEENLATLRARLPAPCLGVLPFASAPDPRALAAHLRNAVAALR